MFLYLHNIDVQGVSENMQQLLTSTQIIFNLIVDTEEGQDYTAEKVSK